MDLAAVTKSVSEIADLAKKQGAEATQELAKVNAHMLSADSRILDLEQKAAVRGGGGRRSEGNYNFGEVLAHDPKIDMLRKGETREARMTQRGSLSMLCKSVLVQTGTSGGSPETGFPTPTEFISPVPQQSPGRSLQVLQALPHLQVFAGTVIVPELAASTDAAAVQEFQAAAKGQSALSVIGRSLPLTTVATWLQASKQLLEDVAALPTFLQSWLGYWVLRKYENLIISGDGSASNGHITGLVNAGTAFTSSQTKNADKIADAIFTALPAYGYAADLVVVSSADYLGIISERGTTGEYVGGGWGAAAPGTLWGVKAIATPGLAAGHAIVLSTQFVRILDRMELQFFIGQPADNFTTNLYTYLAELRGQLSIGDAHAVQVVTLA